MPSYEVRAEGVEGTVVEYLVHAANPAIACMRAKARWAEELPNEPLYNWEVLWSSSPKPPSFVIEPRYE